MAGSIILPILGLALVFGVAIPLMVYYRRLRQKQKAAQGSGYEEQ